MSLSSPPKLIVIVGPTASGKTAWALDLAREFDAEIISADSRQIYRGMDIGTSKPPGVWRDTQYVLHGIPYHLVDLVDPDEEFAPHQSAQELVQTTGTSEGKIRRAEVSTDARTEALGAGFTLAHYQRRAFETIDTIVSRGKLPLLVGGTGLYVQAVVDNLAIPAVKPNEALRKRLAEKSAAELAAMLKAVAPEVAATIDVHNPRRLIRAIEVALTAKQPLGALRTKGTPRYDALQVGIAKPKDELYAAIDARVDEMIEAGLVHEVETLLSRYDRTLPALSGIGYAEIIQHLDGAITLEKTIRLIKTHTRQYARRQMTWFKRDKRISWTSTLVEAQQLIRSFLDTITTRPRP